MPASGTGWSGSAGIGLEEYEEIIGYHLEQAHRYRTELGILDPTTADLAKAAFMHLSASARRARTRSDPAAAIDLGRRALALPLGDPTPRLELLPAVALAMFEVGEGAAAIEMLDEARSEAEPGADHRIRPVIELVRAWIDLTVSGDRRGRQEAQAVADRWLATLEGGDDNEALARAWQLRAQIAWNDGRVSAAEDATKQASRHAALAGHPELISLQLYWGAEFYGNTPTSTAIADLQQRLLSPPNLVAESSLPILAGRSGGRSW